MYLKRTVYDKLLEWKNEQNRSTLEVNGARQVGKTYIINKFADEHFKHKIYFNFFEQSGKQFLECFRQAIAAIPDTKHPEYAFHNALQLFEPDFIDSDDTIIIIDEIQESAAIYNCIQKLGCSFHSRFILISSYPGQLLEPEFLSHNEGRRKLSVYTLSFKEFLQAYDERLYTQYLHLSPKPLQNNGAYRSVKAVYDIYLQIGGYPNVVKTYLENQSTEQARGALIKIIDTFTNESTRYFTDIQDTRVFTQIFLSICRIAGRKSSSRSAEGSIYEEIQDFIARNDFPYISRDTCNHVLNWMYLSGITSFHGETIGADTLDFKQTDRCYCYFMDPGLAHYYLSLIGLNPRLFLNTDS